MARVKRHLDVNVLTAAEQRISYIFDHFERLFVSFSGGKDSTVMLHMAAAEARKRGRTIGVLILDLEAQYTATAEHLEKTVAEYADCIDLHWICLPLLLRNAVTSFEPRWMCWGEDAKEIWVRDKPAKASQVDYPFFQPGMEFEEFVVLFAEWYAQGGTCVAMVGIRCDESLNRFRTIAVFDKGMFNGLRWTTEVLPGVYNAYPIYDWKTEDIWRFHGRYPELTSNAVYDQMQRAGVPLSQQRLCQPYGDDQRKGLWLYHILEPATWFKLIARVNGANSGALYVQENGNVMGYNKIHKPAGHTWKSFCHLLLATLPEKTRNHYLKRFLVFIKGWHGRGYQAGIPDEAPKILEDAQWAPSYRRLCKVLLRNDWWCKGLGLTQPKSEAYGKWLKIKAERKRQAKEAA
jgi:predicted phosphoadenosine phosphosulfate sulfurtransferase